MISGFGRALVRFSSAISPRLRRMIPAVGLGPRNGEKNSENRPILLNSIFRFLEPDKVVRFTFMHFALKPGRRKMRFLPLIAATYFMVSGGPYGIEDILGGAGFARAIVILLVLPILWSLPTALMIGELASAIPAEGGFYIWVRRALGPFWGYQEGWLSLSASIFDMAIYPAIFVLYLGKFNPALTAGWRGYAWSLAVVVLCCVWNLRGAPAVGEDSVWHVRAAARAVRGLRRSRRLARSHARIPPCNGASPASEAALSTAILVAMWNYMGWDNASTVAQEVENPQRNYPARHDLRPPLSSPSLTFCRWSPWRWPASRSTASPPATGRPRRAPSAARCWALPWSAAAPSPASACSTRW